MPEGGVWAEPLQVPPSQPMMIPPQTMPTPPERWDRSELPAGACVFRVHGAPSDCLGEVGQVTLGVCAPDRAPIPLGYYELPNCDRGIAPGCPARDSYALDSFVWYAVTDAGEANETTLVICPALCESVVQAGAVCLRHSPQP